MNVTIAFPKRTQVSKARPGVPAFYGDLIFPGAKFFAQQNQLPEMVAGMVAC